MTSWDANGIAHKDCWNLLRNTWNVGECLQLQIQDVWFWRYILDSSDSSRGPWHNGPVKCTSSSNGISRPSANGPHVSPHVSNRILASWCQICLMSSASGGSKYMRALVVGFCVDRFQCTHKAPKFAQWIMRTAYILNSVVRALYCMDISVQ